MLILEKTASTAIQMTPYLEYESLIIENLSGTDVKVQTTFLDLRGQMVDDGAVVDTLEAYGFLEYSQVITRKKRFWGLVESVVPELGVITFWTESGTADLRFKAFNGAALKQRQWRSLKERNLKGSDDTFLGDSSTTYVLKKTITIYDVRPNEDVYSFFVSGYSLAGAVGGLKITKNVDGGGEETVDEWEIPAGSSDFYALISADPFSGNKIVVKVYVKHSTGSGSAYNRLFKIYGYTASEVSF